MGRKELLDAAIDAAIKGLKEFFFSQDGETRLIRRLFFVNLLAMSIAPLFGDGLGLLFYIMFIVISICISLFVSFLSLAAIDWLEERRGEKMGLSFSEMFDYKHGRYEYWSASFVRIMAVFIVVSLPIWVVLMVLVSLERWLSAESVN